jgi:hypothetical protein
MLSNRLDRLDPLIPVDEHNSCQACDTHKEHERCTGSNTLGTTRCQCANVNHMPDKPKRS